MKRILFAVLVLTLCACASKSAEKKEIVEPAKTTAQAKVKPQAQKPQQVIRTQPAEMDQNGKEYAAKNEGWMVNLDMAFAESEKTGKPIMANFTGSDWCGWCKRLDKSVFHQPGFKDWADKNVVLLELDFPRRFRLPKEIAQQNRQMQQSLGVRGYPTIWLFDMDKDESGKFNISPLGKNGLHQNLS